MSRTFVIGDIHGALRALRQLITRLDLQQNDNLIFLGDYVDGWSGSAQVIEYLKELSNAYSCIFIKGNHDIWCESWLNGDSSNTEWLFHGGKSTIESYNGMNEKQKEDHLAFFSRMKHYHIDLANRLFIHAGFSSMHGPVKEHYESNYSWDRTLWETALTMDKRIKKIQNYTQSVCCYFMKYI